MKRTVFILAGILLLGILIISQVNKYNNVVDDYECKGVHVPYPHLQNFSPYGGAIMSYADKICFGILIKK